MKTDQLIAALAADRTAEPFGRRFVLSFLIGGLISLGLFLAILGPRHDLAEALATWRFDFKIVLMVLILGLAFSFCREVARPVAPPHPARGLLLPLPRRGPRDRARDRAAGGVGHSPGRQQLLDLPDCDTVLLDRPSDSSAGDPALGSTDLAGTGRCRCGPAGSGMRRHALCLPLLRRLAALRRHLVHAGGASRGRHRRLGRTSPAAVVGCPAASASRLR